ncbi:MAG: endonuclease Q family protein [Euryarchaeota archaeon]|nr:endonuclease Q family protein [Euryarchaeota archaeon]
MDLPQVCAAARVKGIDVIGTGDCLYQEWLEELESNLQKRGSCYVLEGLPFILQCEVETTVGGRVHHLLLFPHFKSVYLLRELILEGGYSKLTSGRPQLKIPPEKLADLTQAVGALVGPSHAFTPWTSMYAAYEGIVDCYGKNAYHVAFLELGLSADTKMASRLAELDAYTFVSFSDAHSANLDKLGREMTRFLVQDGSFSEIDQALRSVNGRTVLLNVGLDPREGKYHLTGCRRCKTAYTLDEIIVNGKLLRTCPCGGPLKIGVKDRITLLAAGSNQISRVRRPPYMHVVPLLEILKAMKRSHALDIKQVYSELIDTFGNEIAILVDRPISDIKERYPRLAAIIERFRNDKIDFEFVGRGGWYGKIRL